MAELKTHVRICRVRGRGSVGPRPVDSVRAQSYEAAANNVVGSDEAGSAPGSQGQLPICRTWNDAGRRSGHPWTCRRRAMWYEGESTRPLSGPARPKRRYRLQRPPTASTRAAFRDQPSTGEVDATRRMGSLTRSHCRHRFIGRSEWAGRIWSLFPGRGGLERRFGQLDVTANAGPVPGIVSQAEQFEQVVLVGALASLLDGEGVPKRLGGDVLPDPG
jgi:hypothetical protein